MFVIWVVEICLLICWLLFKEEFEEVVFVEWLVWGFLIFMIELSDVVVGVGVDDFNVIFVGVVLEEGIFLVVICEEIIWILFVLLDMLVGLDW